MRQVTGGLDPTPPDPGIIWGIPPHALLALAAALAVILWRRRDPKHKPVAVALAFILGTGLLHAALRLLVLIPARTSLGPEVPYAGLVRATFHVTQGCVLASALVLPWLARVAFPPGPGRGKILGLSTACTWIGAWATLIVAYPTLRGDALRQVYLAAELAALFVALIPIVLWMRRRSSLAAERSRIEAALAKGWNDITATAADRAAMPRWYTIAAVLCLVGGDAALLIVGAWRHGLFGPAYMLQQAGLSALYFALVCIHVFALVIGRRPMLPPQP